MNGIVSFTTAPIRLGLFLGFVLASLSLFYSIVHFFVSVIFYRELAPPGIMTLITALFFFGGVQLFFLGLIGEYVLATFGQVRNKPVVFESERINFQDSLGTSARSDGCNGTPT
jgi:hypothetical protein